jgi:hypothetical protein
MTGGVMFGGEMSKIELLIVRGVELDEERRWHPTESADVRPSQLLGRCDA